MKYIVLEKKVVSYGEQKTKYFVVAKNRFLRLFSFFMYDDSKFGLGFYFDKDEALRVAKLKSNNNFNKIISKRILIEV